MSTSNAFATVEALRIVLREEQPPAMAEVLRDMERARMSTEDARAAMASPYSTHVYTADSPPRRRILSWREHGVECDRLVHNVIEPVIERLEEGRQKIRTALSDPNITDKAALTAAYVAIFQVTGFLEETSEDEKERGRKTRCEKRGEHTSKFEHRPLY